MVVRLSCAVQPYAWGKNGEQSKVAQFGNSACDNDFKIESKPYAELWMGTHVKGPSKIQGTQQLLSSWLAENKHTLGDKLKSSPDFMETDQGVQLPLLFKVLSVNQALSVQVHPTKDQAKILHSADPKNYPDPNHKPEMAIALTPFELMCGFRPFNQILEHLLAVPQLQKLVGQETVTKFQSNQNKENLKAVFSNLMKQDPSLVSNEVQAMVESFEKGTSLAPDLVSLIQRLNKDFPGDIGVFAPLLLNYFTLEPGESTFLGPNEPHAYLSGDCIECMACSDNTIRAGLTPKYKDVNNLCELLTYRTGAAEDNKLKSNRDPSGCPFVTMYSPPVADFAVRKIEMSSSESNATLPPLPSCSILLVTNGTGSLANVSEALQPGVVYLIPAGHQLSLSVAGSEKFIAYEAFYPG